jgi:anti-sigma-K factor RskA
VDASRFISSGAIEAYVGKLATPADVQELERYVEQSPEVAAAVDDCQLDMEQYITLQSVTPPPAVKAKLLEILTFEEEARNNGTYTEETVVEESPREPILVSGIWRWVAAASIIIAAGSALFGYTYFNRYNDYKGRYEGLLAENTSLAANKEVLRTRMEQAESSLHMVKDPAMKAVKMAGTKAFPNTMATVYWNTTSKEVFVLVNNLPQPSSDKQYQLWAIVDGKPVDMGVFDTNEQTSALLQKMKSIEKAEMFAVTLETKGGSPTPTLDQMYVAGKAG